MSYHKNRVALTLKNLKIQVGTQTVIEDGDLVIHEGEKIGLIGANGTGKSTIIRAIMNEIELDGGEIMIPKDLSVGYLSQSVGLDPSLNVKDNIRQGAEYITNLIAELDKLPLTSPKRTKIQDDLTKHDGWNLDKRIDDLVIKLSIPTESKDIKNLSGGEKRRIALAKAIVSNPDILILDEPTNHLDIDTISWLESFLSEYKGTCLLITHDRYFLDKVTTRIIELDRASFYSHAGNYSDYIKSKKKREQVELNKEDKRQKFLKKEIGWVRSGVKARGTKDRGRLERFYEIAEQEGYKQVDDASILIPPPPRFSKRILDLKNISYKIGDRRIINEFDFSFDKGCKIAIVGPNGAGKTTFLKLLLKQLEVDSGKVITGDNTKFNYFDQSKVKLNPDNTVIKEIGEGSDRIEFGGKNISVRGYLKRFLFTDDKIKSVISNLSGGEKSRLLLAKILKNGGNFLILDEPTNDLDLETLSILEKALADFAGCVLVVSHDRYFLNKVCSKVLYFKGDGVIERYEGNYDDFERQRVAKIGKKDKSLVESSQNKVKPELSKEERNELRKIERKISNAEGKVARIEEKFADPEIYSDLEKTKELIAELDEAKVKVDELYVRWEELEGKG